ncbi:hypothetical protein [Gynurincola endophyticus]|uniref:hypothetical protein n=1 Tax=Gynurincola endophyticus TaxID=2479004 RepID=UPI000F8D8633|nr:hypothetical protein [Gynurincola endophyticus]
MSTSLARVAFRSKMLLLLGSIIFSGTIAKAQSIINPSVKTSSSFAIVIDNKTYEAVEKEVLAYKSSIEADGLGTYIISHNWKNPEEIREVLKKLYKAPKSPLEGVVFIGNIPVPMIREAQYLTSTFKMVETIRWDRSSVPSDRFYDDFDLQFEFLKQDEDSSRKNLFYYKIKAESPQYIEMDIYSARIKPPAENQQSSIEQIRNYLQKVVAVKKESNPLNNMIVSTGHGYNSNSTISWAGEVAAIRTTFPALFTKGHSIKFLNYRNADFMKNNLLTELRRENLDLAFMTGHGTATLQLLNGYPDASAPQPSMENVARYIRSKMRNAKEAGRNLEEVKAGFQKSLGLNDKWFEDAFIQEKIDEDSIFNDKLDMQTWDLQNINARVAYLNSCLTGSFHLNDYLAGYYPFSNGKNVAAFANSVGVLQDLWSIQLLGILQHGVRVGHLLKKTAYLETHIMGDPTYHFQAPQQKYYNSLMGSQTSSAKEWQKILKNGDADLQSYALTELFKTQPEAQFTSQLYNILTGHTNESVRTQAYFLLRRYENTDLKKLVTVALNDNYEYIQRKAAYDIAEQGDDELFKETLTHYINNQEMKRVIYKLDWSIPFFNNTISLPETDRLLKNDPDNKELHEKLTRKLTYEKQKLSKMEDNLRNEKATDKELIADLRTLRAYRYHQLVPAALALAGNTKSAEQVRVAALEALSWFGFSYHKQEILQLCEKLTSDANPAVATQALKTIHVIKETGRRPF